MTLASVAERWLPITVNFNPTMVSVQWMEFGSKTITEPFFQQTVRRLKTASPPAAERVTSLSTLIEAAEALPTVRPAGLIFHVSRCGSTLLANALRTADDVVLLSEARPVGAFFRPNVFKDSPFPSEGWADARRMLLDCISTLYAHSTGGPDPKLVIKCHAASVLQIALIRSVWPDVPFVVVVREPVDVIISNMAKAAGWLKSRKRPRISAFMFGWKPDEIQGMSAEEFCARGIGRFCEAALNALGPYCRVIDYESLDAERMRAIAEFFGISLPPADAPRFRKAIDTYAKDPEGKRAFASDRERKRQEATDAVKLAAQRWAQGPYEALRRLEHW